MGGTFRKPLLAAMVTGALVASPVVLATNGIAPTGLGQVHKAMGGAAAGYAANTMSMATNPASASFIKDGYDVGIEAFKPSRSATFKLGGASVKNDGNGDEMFPIPEAGYKKDIKGGISLGVVAYGNGGMNTAYDKGVFFPAGTTPNNFANGSGTTGVDLKQIFVSPTASYAINDRVAVGASVNFVQQRFEAEGLGRFDNAAISQSPGNVTNRGGEMSNGVGATVGVQGKLSDRLSAGISYRSKVDMSKLDKYKGLFPDGGDFDVPASTTVGIAYKATPKTLVAADVQHIAYSDVGAIGNSPALFNSGKQFGSADGPGFGWDDMTVYKVGVKHQMNEGLALMAGYNHGESPISSNTTTVNVLAPGVVEDHLALGFEKKLSPKSKLTGSYVHAFENTVKGDGVIPSAGIPMGAYDLTMDQDAVGIGYSVEF